MKSAIALAFIDNTMFVSTAHGVYGYSISDPSAPQLIGALPMFIWENEDMDVDERRNLLFISRDPRGFTTPATPGSTFPYGAVHIIDVSVPHAMVQVSAFPVPAGHTTTCVSDCDYAWTSGPYANPVTQPNWTGRPVFATDIRDPLDPRPCPKPIDIGRNDGVTDYAHDVQVDPRGIAWVSGAGGVRGYWTEGKHKDPLTGKVRKATGCKPIPYAGGGTPASATSSRFMHNSWRNPSLKVDGRRGDVLFGTEENLTSDCRESGRFASYDLKGSYNGEGWKNIDKTHFRMRVLDTWTPHGAKGATGCASAHYFSDRGDGVLAYAFYGQGTRFLDASNPRNIRQIGYFRPNDANTWAAYWYKGLVFIPDFRRGVDVVKFGGGSNSKSVVAPVDTSAPPDGLEFDPDLGYLCPLRP
ncbi:MAG: hypothetical protein M3280_10515 [Actinomycetota bacterium]|nr:hypothetical protein [Actinomycetota bacterium]